MNFQMEEVFKKFVILFIILAAADCELPYEINSSPTTQTSTSSKHISTNIIATTDTISKREDVTDLSEFKKTIIEYIEDVKDRNTIKLWPGVSFDKKISKNEDARARNNSTSETGEGIIENIKEFLEDRTLKIELARSSTGVEEGRFFFFKGLKKLMWPLFIGLQVVKTVLLVLFLPSIIGSVGKIVGKGLPSLSGTFSQFSQPAAHSEPVDDLDFKDNSFNSENDSDGTFNSAYQYNIPDSKANFVSQMYESAQANNANKRIGTEYSKNNGILSKRDDFKVFHDIPSSSLLLSNYDPFYSPLLSRLDAIFQQLGMARSTDERCREKLVCLMYSNPAKYAPYSNLVSAQLSRELNELRKPTSDNPDILRFFKYMRAAKDGQDGIDCEISYKECSSFSDMSGPAMINTFNDINKLVQARKLKK